MKFIQIIFIILIASSCSSITTINRNKVEETTSKRVVEVKPNLVVSKITTFNGKAEYFEFQTHLKNGSHFITCDKKKLPLYVVDNKAMLYLAESYFSKAKSYDCLLQGKKILEINRKEYSYKSEKLSVNKKRVFLSKKDLKRVLKERKIKEEIYKKSSPIFLFHESFKKPLDSFITSHYGNRRLFNNKKQSQHLGNDFRARRPTPIPSSNRGRVVFTGDLFYSGKTVVVDHGLGIFTAYGHFSKIYAVVGDIVNRGDILGLSGSTGRVSGPHLHWGVKIHGHWVDGFSLVSESLEQFRDE